MTIDWDFVTPVGGMQVGDSFFVPSLTPKQTRRDVQYVARQFGKKLRSEVVIEDMLIGVRFWRTE